MLRVTLFTCGYAGGKNWEKARDDGESKTRGGERRREGRKRRKKSAMHSS